MPPSVAFKSACSEGCALRSLSMCSAPLSSSSRTLTCLPAFARGSAPAKRPSKKSLTAAVVFVSRNARSASRAPSRASDRTRIDAAERRLQIRLQRRLRAEIFVDVLGALVEQFAHADLLAGVRARIRAGKETEQEVLDRGGRLRLSQRAFRLARSLARFRSDANRCRRASPSNPPAAKAAR